jgi:hypothetical protein
MVPKTHCSHDADRPERRPEPRLEFQWQRPTAAYRAPPHDLLPVRLFGGGAIPGWLRRRLFFGADCFLGRLFFGQWPRTGPIPAILPPHFCHVLSRSAFHQGSGQRVMDFAEFHTTFEQRPRQPLPKSLENQTKLRKILMRFRKMGVWVVALTRH